MNKIYLGRLKPDTGTFAAGERIYLTKHKWDCGWYWAFGYVGNAKTHFHFDNLLYPKKGGQVQYLASEIFQSTPISDADWWVIRDLFVQAYALKKAAEVYQHGGHQTTREGVTDLIKNLAMARTLNADLERVLDKVWEVVSQAVNK